MKLKECLKKPGYRKRLIKLLLLFIVIISVFYTVRYPETLIKSMCRYLTVKDDKMVADVIVILGGWEFDARLEHGIGLYKEGYGKKIILSGAGGSEAYRKKQLLSEGVNEEDILMEVNSTSTYENALFTKEIIEREGYRSIILVTTPDQSRRARFIFRKVYKKSNVLIFISPVTGTPFSPEIILKSKEAKERLILETVKLVHYYVKYLFY